MSGYKWVKTLLKDYHYGLNTWDSPSFSFRGDETSRIRWETSSWNLKKSSAFFPSSLDSHNVDNWEPTQTK